MNKIYDNGALMLGKAKDILDYTDFESIDNEEVYDMIKELKELIEIDKNIVVCVNYEKPMGYNLDYWTERDIIKECE